MQTEIPNSSNNSKNRRQPILVETAQEWYEVNADFFAEECEEIRFETIHSSFLKHLPQQPCKILEIGSGTGRDAAGLANLGHVVVAVEPSNELRTRAQSCHTQANIRWFDDKLPKLEKVIQLGDQYDVIFLSAVWMHLAPSERKSAFALIVGLLKPRGLVYITLRHGPFEEIEGFWDIPDYEVMALATDYELNQLDQVHEGDLLGRRNIRWTRFTFISRD